MVSLLTFDPTDSLSEIGRDFQNRLHGRNIRKNVADVKRDGSGPRPAKGDAPKKNSAAR